MLKLGLASDRVSWLLASVADFGMAIKVPQDVVVIWPARTLSIDGPSKSTISKTLLLHVDGFA